MLSDRDVIEKARMIAAMVARWDEEDEALGTGEDEEPETTIVWRAKWARQLFALEPTDG